MIENQKSGFFAKIQNREDAIKIAKDGASGFFVLAAIEIVASFFLGFSLLIDAAVYVACGFFIRQFFSRVAAVIVLILSVAALVVTLMNSVGGHNGGGRNLLLGVIVVIAGVRAVEATFKLNGKYSEANIASGATERSRIISGEE